MNFSDGVKSKLNKKKKELESEEVLRETFNSASLKLIDRFMKDVAVGAVRVESVTDLSRLFQIYAEVNNIKDIGGTGGGSLPALAPKDRDALASFVEIETRPGVDGAIEETIDLSALANMSEKDVEAMLVKKELELNKKNEEMF